MLAAFAVVDGDVTLPEIDVFDPQPQGLALAQAAAVEQLGDQAPGIFQAGEDRADFFPGQHHGRAAFASAGQGKADLDLGKAGGLSGRSSPE